MSREVYIMVALGVLLGILIAGAVIIVASQDDDASTDSTIEEITDNIISETEEETTDETTTNTQTTTGSSVQLRGEAWADNWFALYLDEDLVIEDSVSINTERSFNSETFTFNATYPINLNFILKDYKENDTGLEYIGTDRQQLGDGGFIAQFTDTSTGEVVGVTNSSVKCFPTQIAPLNLSCANESNPVAGSGACAFEEVSEPAGWKSASYDDSGWESASVYSSSEVDPKDGYDSISWDSSAQLIWGDNLETVNTLICKMTIEE